MKVIRQSAVRIHLRSHFTIEDCQINRNTLTSCLVQSPTLSLLDSHLLPLPPISFFPPPPISFFSHSIVLKRNLILFSISILKFSLVKSEESDLVLFKWNKTSKSLNTHQSILDAIHQSNQPTFIKPFQDSKKYFI